MKNDSSLQSQSNQQEDSSSQIRHFLENLLPSCKRQGKRFRVNPDNGQPEFQDAYFYLYAPLKQYFQDTARVNGLLDRLLSSEERIKLQPQSIEYDYVKIFAILIIIGEGRWIQYFVEHQIRDNQLPFYFTDIPEFWPVSTNKREEFWNLFRKEQWSFCPHHFETSHLNTKIRPLTILPLEECDIIDDRIGGTTIYRVKIYPEYHGLYVRGDVDKPQNPNLHNVFVIKSLDGTEAEHTKRYEKEVSAFNTLEVIPMLGQPKPPEEIVRCYGSFVQDNTYNIILEFADQGTLSKYFQNVPPPDEEQEMTNLWNGLSKIAAGVSRIHNVLNKSDRSSLDYVHQGYHQDLKPDNILVFSNGETSPYRYTFKIADLGLSYFMRRSGFASDPQGPAEIGSRTYGSPEKHKLQHQWTHHTISGQASDNWALACIYSVAATWIVSGKEGIRKFADRRREERQRLSRSDIDCFHDDEKVLEAVGKWHNELYERARRWDRYTAMVYGDVLHNAFDCDIGSRSHASQIANAIKRLPKSVDRNSINQTSQFDSRYAETPRGSQHQSEYHLSQSSIPMSPQSPTRTRRLDRTQQHAYGRGSDILDGALYSEPESHADLANALPVTKVARQNTSESRVVNSPQGTTEFPDELHSPPVREQSAQPNDGLEANEHAHAVDKHDKRCPGYSKEPRKPLPYMSVSEFLSWKARRDINKNAPIKDAGWKDTLRKHDHVFIVDDSQSMREHWEELVKLFTAIAKFVKDCDPDRLELYTTVSREPTLKAKDSSPLSKRVQELGNNLTADSQPERVLRDVLDDYREKIRFGKPINKLNMRNRERKPIPLCIYVFTDGVWQDNTNLTNIIREYVDLLEQVPKLPDYHVGIQFIRFGNDSKGIQRLNDLDKLGKNIDYGTSHYLDQSSLPKLARDIVDTEPSTGNVWKMLLGSVNKWFDDDIECLCEKFRQQI